VLEKRWDQIRELAAMDDDEIGVPPEYWHDTNRVETWIEEMRRKRKEKYSN